MRAAFIGGLSSFELLRARGRRVTRSSVLLRPGAFVQSLAALVIALCFPRVASADTPVHRGGEANLVLPDLGSVTVLGMSGSALLSLGLLVAAAGIAFGLIVLNHVKNLPTHSSMAEVSQIIWETCKTYLITQGKFILVLQVLVGAIIAFYFGVLQDMGALKVLIILAF